MSGKQEKRLRKLYSKTMNDKAWNDVKIIYAKYNKMRKNEILKTIMICVSVTVNILLTVFIYLGR